MAHAPQTVPQTQIIHDKIAALQAEIQALQGFIDKVDAAAAAAPAPEPEVDAEAALQRGHEATTQEAIAEGEAILAEELAADLSMQDAIEQAIAGGSDFDPNVRPEYSAEAQAAGIPDLDPDVGGYGLPPIKTGRTAPSEELEAHRESKAERKQEFPEKASKADEARAAERTHWDEDKLAEEGYTPSAAEAPDPALLESLFLAAHGGPFDPNSSADAGKMEAIQQLLASGQDFGDLAKDKKAQTRFALQLYRQ